MRRVGWFLMALNVLACEPDVQIHAELQPAASATPAAPQCESLADKCLAKGDTAARLPGVRWVFTPPSGWTYAQMSDQTIAEKAADKKAVMVVATFDPPKVNWELKKLQLEMIDKLTGKLGVTPKNRDVLDANIEGRPTDVPVGSLKLQGFEQEGGKRGERAGNVLVIVGPIDNKQLIVVAFAPKGDEDDSGLISGAVQTLKKGSP